MSDILKEFRVSLYNLFNKIVYRRAIVENIIGMEMRKHLTIEEFGERQVQYCVIEEKFPDEDLEELVVQEKGLTMESDIIGFTEIIDDKTIYCAFSLDAVLKYLEGYNPIAAYFLIKEVARHELFHAKQYNYILNKGGKDAIRRVSEYMKSVEYTDNILEQGAWDFQFDEIEQDFSVFDQFIFTEKFDDMKKKKISPR